MLFQSILVGGNFPKIYWYNFYLKQFVGKLNYIFFAQIIYCTIYLGNTIPCVMGPSWSYGSWIYNYMCNQCLSSLKLWVQTLLKVCQWSVTGRWFSPGTPSFSTNKTDCHDESGVKHLKQKPLRNTLHNRIEFYIQTSSFWNLRNLIFILYFDFMFSTLFFSVVKLHVN